MITYLTLLCLALGFLLTLYTLPKWIRISSKIGLVGEDVNKYKKAKVAEAGGICVLFSFIIAFFLYIGFNVFYYETSPSAILFSFAAASTIILAGFIGFIDDILGWRIGLRKITKVLMTFFIPLPIMVLNAGDSLMQFPLLGAVNLGIMYPLIAIPIAIIGTTNAFNMLAGYNGLEAGLGTIIISSLAVITYLNGNNYLAALCLFMAFALLAFLIFNFYPAKVFPGDTLTYSVGALIGVVAVIANVEKFALILFAPYFLELALKARTVFQKSSWATSDSKGRLKNKYGRFYGIPNIAISLLRRMKGSAREWEVVIAVYCFEMVFVLITFLSYFRVILL